MSFFANRFIEVFKFFDVLIQINHLFRLLKGSLLRLVLAADEKRLRRLRVHFLLTFHDYLAELLSICLVERARPLVTGPLATLSLEYL